MKTDKKTDPAPGRKQLTQSEAQQLEEQQFKRFEATLAEAKNKQVPFFILDLRHMTFDKVQDTFENEDATNVFDGVCTLLRGLQKHGFCKFEVLTNYEEYVRAKCQQTAPANAKTLKQ